MKGMGRIAKVVSEGAKKAIAGKDKSRGRGIAKAMSGAVRSAMEAAKNRRTAGAMPAQQQPGKSVTESGAGMAGTSGTAMMKKGGMADKRGRAMKKTSADAEGRAMPKKMMGGGMTKAYKRGGSAKKGC
jgi:hypothetical protein